MAKNKPPKNKPFGRLPTGVAKPHAYPSKSKAPVSPAATPNPKSHLDLAGISAQSSLKPLPTQEDPKSSLAEHPTSTPSKTLAVGSPSTPSKEAVDLAPATEEAAAANPPGNLAPATKEVAANPSAADLWKGEPKGAKKHKHVDAQEANASDSTPPAKTAPSSDSKDFSGSSVSISHDLSKGSLCVDLSAEGSFEDQQSSPDSSGTSGSSSDTNLSEGEDNSKDEGDEFPESCQSYLELSAVSWD
ncbi:Uncharacterized protein Rs2_39699 [Raphanus sativus]|nr:Uncharacterized protein Rs2_39699 [Raphanus sativus]